MNTGPMTRSEANVLVDLLDRLYANTPSEQVAAIQAVRGMALYHFTHGPAEPYSAKVRERAHLRIAAEVESPMYP